MPIVSVTASLAPLNVSFDDPGPVAWPSTYTLSGISDYPFGPPQDDSIEAYVERRYLECLWMPEVLEPLTSLVPALQRITPPSDWSPAAGPHPLHSNWGKEWLHEAEKREILMQILLRMLKLTLPPPPMPKRKRRKDKDAPEPSPFKESLPDQYETLRYHCMPPPSRDTSPVPSDSSIIDLAQSQSLSQSQPQQLARSLSRATSISSRTGTLNARSLSRASTTQSRSRSGSVEPDPDARARSRSRSVSFAARSAGGIRAPVKAGVKPRGGKAKPKQLSAAPGASKLSRISAPIAESQSQPLSQKSQSTVLVAETPQKPARMMSREVSVGGTSFMQRLQGQGASRKVSLDKSAFEEFMVSSPERLGSSDFDFGDLALETPRR
ncbi:hypothetical protein RSAG8_13074, partial [Rhizoctonia solani AG-8 WAC10335]